MGAEADREWMKGYEDARAVCLSKGAEAARRRALRGVSAAYEAGFDWGCWDYEDANGLPHDLKVERGA